MIVKFAHKKYENCFTQKAEAVRLLGKEAADYYVMAISLLDNSPTLRGVTAFAFVNLSEIEGEVNLWQMSIKELVLIIEIIEIDLGVLIIIKEVYDEKRKS